jgi:hypothetical protein
MDDLIWGHYPSSNINTVILNIWVEYFYTTFENDLGLLLRNEYKDFVACFRKKKNTEL